MPRHQKKAVLASSALTKQWANQENLFSTLFTADAATQTKTAEKITRNANQHRELCEHWNKEEFVAFAADINQQLANLQYCAKVMQAKCVNFVLCSRDFSTKVRSKNHMKFHGVSSDNFLEQRAIFLRSFIQPKKIHEHKR